MGGAKERFDARTLTNSGDTRNLPAELQAQGYTYINTRTQLNALPATGAPGGKLLGLFRTGNMNVAYDKLGLVRPADEVTAALWLADQFRRLHRSAVPRRDDGKSDRHAEQRRQPVHPHGGRCVDRQAVASRTTRRVKSGTRSSSISRSVSVALLLTLTNGKKKKDDTLVIVSADHDQSIHVLGVVDTTVPNATLNVRNQQPFTGLTGEVDGLPDYADANGDGYPENTNRYRVSVGYRTGGHTGSSVPVTAEGPGALLFTGYYDQTDIFFKMARVLSSNTAPLDQALEQKGKFGTIDQNY